MQKLEALSSIESYRYTILVQPNRKQLYLMVKRLVDIVVSALAMIILSPVFLVVGIAIKLEDPNGRIIYSHLRTGKDGIPFRTYKFRSMHSNADEMQAKLMDLNEMDGPAFKIREDPRVTKVGKFIRKFSIDEFPQFWNVLRGDMSLVGPRPMVVKEASACNSFQKQRELVRPGITCTWQISGRNDVSFQRWMEMDIEYIAKQSLRMDFMLLIKTIPAVISSRGAS